MTDIDINQTALTGRAPGGTVRAFLSQLGQTVRGEDAGDGEQGGHPRQLCRGEEHAALEDSGRLWVSARRQLSVPLPVDLAAAAGHQEGGGGGQDRQRLLQPAQEGHGGTSNKSQRDKKIYIFKFDPDNLFSEPVKYKSKFAYAR